MILYHTISRTHMYVKYEQGESIALSTFFKEWIQNGLELFIQDATLAILQSLRRSIALASINQLFQACRLVTQARRRLWKIPMTYQKNCFSAAGAYQLSSFLSIHSFKMRRKIISTSSSTYFIRLDFWNLFFKFLLAVSTFILWCTNIDVLLLLI